LINNADADFGRSRPKNSVLNRHRFDVDPDPYQTFHFDADPDLDLDPTPSFTHVEKSEFFFTFIHLVKSFSSMS
jgi:hypothetical protein